MGTKSVLRASDGRVEARLVSSLGWKQKHGSDCAVDAAKDKIGRSYKSVLDQDEVKSTKHLPGSKQYTSSWVKWLDTVHDVDTILAIIQKEIWMLNEYRQEKTKDEQ